MERLRTGKHFESIKFGFFEVGFNWISTENRLQLKIVTEIRVLLNFPSKPLSPPQKPKFQLFESELASFQFAKFEDLTQFFKSAIFITNCPPNSREELGDIFERNDLQKMLYS